MLSIWRANTIVLVCQLVIGTAFYAEVHDVATSAAAVAFLSFCVATGINTAALQDDLQIMAVAGVINAVGVMLASLNLGMVAALASVIAIAWAYFVATANARYRQEAWPLVFVAALPLGVGTVLGGAILSYLWMHARTDEPLVR